MERVSSTAAALLQLESAGGWQHAGWLARLDPQDGPLDVGALRAAVETRLKRTPRLRQIPLRVPEATDELVWSDAPDFEIANHVLTGPATDVREEDLRDAVDAFLAASLPRGRPLWRVLVVPHTRTGGAVVVGTVHRALADGNDAALLLDLVFDPAPTVSADRSATDRLALEEFRAARRVEPPGSGSTRIGATLRRVALSRTVGPLVPAPPSFLDGSARGRTTFVTARVDLGRLTRIAEHTETTVHDVVLAVAAGTLRRLAIAGGDAEPNDLRALVPMESGDGTLLGDRPCAVLQLPVSEPLAASRLAVVREAMDAAGHAGADGMTRTTTVLAGPPEELATRLALGARVCNLTIPSAQGPDSDRRVGGARVRALFPIAPVLEDHSLALGTLNYGRHLHVGAAADARAVSAIGRLPVMLADAVEELGLSTGARGNMTHLAPRMTRRTARR